MMLNSQVMKNPNEYDPDSMKSCYVTFDVNDLPNLSRTEQDRLLKIVGPDNSCVAGPEVCSWTPDIFVQTLQIMWYIFQ
jgi:hypothetical protein